MVADEGKKLPRKGNKITDFFFHSIYTLASHAHIRQKAQIYILKVPTKANDMQKKGIEKSVKQENQTVEIGLNGTTCENDRNRMGFSACKRARDTHKCPKQSQRNERERNCASKRFAITQNQCNGVK